MALYLFGMAGVTIGRLLHLLLVVALRSESCCIIPISGPDKLGVVLDMVACCGDLVATEASPTVGVTVYKGRI